MADEESRVDPKVNERVWAMLAEIDPEIGDGPDLAVAIAHLSRHENSHDRCCSLAQASVILSTWKTEKPMAALVETLRDVRRDMEAAARKLQTAIDAFGHFPMRGRVMAADGKPVPCKKDLEPYAKELAVFCLELERIEKRFCDYGGLPVFYEGDKDGRWTEPTTVVAEGLSVSGFSHAEIGGLIGATGEQVRDRLRYLKKKRKKKRGSC